ncbi:MAG: DUF3524 domain-containing protein [Dehalococcoidia bacterium]
MVEPFYGGSHRAFLDELVRHVSHELVLLTLPGGEWRKRMRLGAQQLARAARDLEGDFEFLLVTDMLDLPAFLALTRPRFDHLPVLAYFHENQFTYPRIRGTKLNSWFGQINYLTALAADRVAFNSAFHRDAFIGALETLARQPNNWLDPAAIDGIRAKSSVLPVGVDLTWLDAMRPRRPASAPPLLLWNHRWEFDKGPELFVRTLERLASDGVAFGVAVAGEPGDNPVPALLELPQRLGERVEHFGYCHDRAAYGQLLWDATIAVSTSRHEFFGVGMVEAMYCRCVPIAPNRLNYPALVPRELHDVCLYEGDAGLYRALRAAIEDARPDTTIVREAAAAYRWDIVAPMWERAISELAMRA